MLFDHHIHSKYSKLDSLSEIDDIIKTAKEVGLSGIAVSDHDTIEGSLKASKKSSKGLIIMPSMEISSLDGHILGLGITKKVERDLSAKETVDKIHKLGGVAIAAHPYDHVRMGVGDLCWELDFDAIEINGHCLYGNSDAEAAAKKHGKPMVGGSDAHSLSGVGVVCTEVEGKSADEILSNIKAGKCKPIVRRNGIMLKTAIITDSIARKYHLSRKL